MNDVQSNILPQKSINFGTDELDFRELLASLLRAKKIILTCVLTCFLCSLLYVFIKTPLYQADILIQVQDKQNGLASNLTQDIANLMNANAQISPVDVQKSLITSRFILDPVIQNLGLDVIVQPHYMPILNWFFAKKGAETLVKPKLGTSRYAWGGEKLVISNLTVPHSYEKKAQKLRLVAKTEDTYKLYGPKNELLLEGRVGELAKTSAANLPSISIKVENLTANPGTEFYLIKKSRSKVLETLAKRIAITDLGTSRTGNNTGILQIALTDKNPQTTVNILNAIAEVTVEKDIERKSAEAEKTYLFIEKQLPIAKHALETAETKLNKYRSKSGKIDLKLESQMLLSQLSATEQNIAQLRLQKAEMLQDYTSKHPFVGSVNDKIKGLEKDLGQMQMQLKKLPASDQIAVGLMRDVDVKNQLYLLLLNKLQEMRVLKAGTVSDVRILSLAEYPDDPIPTKPLLIIAAGIFLGLILGAGIVLLRKSFTQHVEDPYWIEQNFNISNLAIVPHSKTQDKNVKQFSTGAIKQVPILAASQPQDMAIESMRSLRTSLQFMLPQADNNVISIMGLSPGIGKSFVSVNLAYVLADIGKKVLLIDGDIRKGHMHNYFGRSRNSGLTEVLNNKLSFAEAVVEANNANLHFLPTGNFIHNPSELLVQPKFKELIAEVSKLYDVVVIDTSPILAVTDGVLVAKHAATNLMVLGAAEHSKQEIEIGIRRLASNAIKLNGAVFNNKREQVYVYGDTRYQYSYN